MKHVRGLKKKKIKDTTDYQEDSVFWIRGMKGHKKEKVNISEMLQRKLQNTA